MVLYFYPRDDTPGCTREACSFCDRKKELARLGAAVLGVSTDTVESHAKFRDKYGLHSYLTSRTGPAEPESRNVIPSPPKVAVTCALLPRLSNCPWTVVPSSGSARYSP